MNVEKKNKNFYFKIEEKEERIEINLFCNKIKRFPIIDFHLVQRIDHDVQTPLISV